MTASGSSERKERAQGRSLAAILVLVLGAIAVGAATWLVSAWSSCPTAGTGTSASTGVESPEGSEDAAAAIGEPPPTMTAPRAPRSAPGTPPDRAVVRCRSGLLASGVSGAGVLLVGGVALALAGATRRTTPSRAQAPVVRAPDFESPPRPGGGGGKDDRRTLVNALIYALDRLQGTAVEVRLQEALAKAGVQKVGAPGEIFDPSRHEAVAGIPVTTAQQDGTLADVDEVGYLDGDVLIRPAQVTVYQAPR